MKTFKELIVESEKKSINDNRFENWYKEKVTVHPKGTKTVSYPGDKDYPYSKGSQDWNENIPAYKSPTEYHSDAYDSYAWHAMQNGHRPHNVDQFKKLMSKKGHKSSSAGDYEHYYKDTTIDSSHAPHKWAMKMHKAGKESSPYYVQRGVLDSQTPEAKEKRMKTWNAFVDEHIKK